MADASGVKVDVANKEDLQSSSSGLAYGGAMGDFNLGMSTTAIKAVSQSKTVTALIVVGAVLATAAIMKKRGA